jgi:hypothetical protein
MRRYLVTIVVATGIGVVCLWLYAYLFGTSAQVAIASVRKVWAVYPGHAAIFEVPERIFTHYSKVKRAEDLAFQLDLMDNAVPFVIGFPAIAVLSLWTFDRRRKQKSA